MNFIKQYRDVYKDLDLESYSQDELDEFGKKLVRVYQIHMCFIGYSDIKDFDFYSEDIYTLSDISKDLVMGMSYVGRNNYIDKIDKFLNEVGNFSIGNPKTSVKRGLQTSVRKEMVDMRTSYNNRNSFAFWDTI